MGRWLLVSALLLGCVGCSFHRADFVSGADGQPGDVSSTGKTVGDLLRNRGPSYSLNF